MSIDEKVRKKTDFIKILYFNVDVLVASFNIKKINYNKEDK